jgi:hypothetical protein
MKRERFPSLSPPPSALRSAAGGDEPPPSDEELREAAALREAISCGGDPLASALRAAWEPSALDDGDLEAILERAIGEGDAPPTRIERAAASRLREELARGQGSGEEAAIIADLEAAYRPSELDPALNEAMLERAFREGDKAKARRFRLVRGGDGAAEQRAPHRSRIVPLTMAALGSVAALAAGIALVAGQLDRSSAPMASAAPVALIHARSADDLFDPAEKFEVGQQSARVDRIASARAADLRSNRFAAWGVR